MHLVTIIIEYTSPLLKKQNKTKQNKTQQHQQQQQQQQQRQQQQQQQQNILEALCRLRIFYL